MAFHMSKLTLRLPKSIRFGLRPVNGTSTKHSCIDLKFTNITSAANSRSLHSVFRRASESWSANYRLVKPKQSNFRWAVSTAKRLENFSSASLASKSFHLKSVSTPIRNSWSRSYTVVSVLGLSTGVIAALHTSVLLAMSETIDLDSDRTAWQEAKSVLLSASQEKRRGHYKIDYLPLEKIPVWASKGTSTAQPHYKSNDALRQKISLFRGDITKLEIDAIVNAANKSLLGGGGVDGAIHRGAGPLLKKECATLGGCETGEAKITGAYGLPAKHVVHTVGPIAYGGVGDKERNALRDCYLNSLKTAVQNQLRTVAFPCISTGVYGYPPEDAVEVALATVREYLDEHHEQLDRVIFCVFLKTDEDLYQRNLPLYFPQGSSVKSKL
ncbi:ADP-ribose glycohydrolase MACROD1 isoform X2 [Sardina pilchardus]|uniref:ADP-ribose glycohydrolase MACROD1 isoform X2 n=1 Tax=Sardina pilchardus TaxID=27697 RepID=UPI002E15235E